MWDAVKNNKNTSKSAILLEGDEEKAKVQSGQRRASFRALGINCNLPLSRPKHLVGLMVWMGDYRNKTFGRPHDCHYTLFVHRNCYIVLGAPARLNDGRYEPLILPPFTQIAIAVLGIGETMLL